MYEQPPDLKFWLALNHFPKFGPVRLGKLKRHFPDMGAAFVAPAKELLAAGLDEKIIEEFCTFRRNLEPNQILDEQLKEGIKTILFDDPDYPKKLKEIYAPPPLLHYKGLAVAAEICLAVVGTRKFSLYGQQITDQLVFALAKNNLCIVSGLALGIDTLAHTAALAAKGRTIAVLGSGLNQRNIYPATNRYLADQIIAEGGQLISEFPIGTPPLRHHFPQRNRIVAGLSVGTLIIEAAEKSGSLITANHALEQNREIFAVPGSVFSPVSVGPNKLIKQGAIPVTEANDILATLDLSQITHYIKQNTADLNLEEKAILTHLTAEPIYVDELSKLSQLPIAKLNSNLMIMEIKGLVKNLGGMKYIKN